MTSIPTPELPQSFFPDLSGTKQVTQETQHIYAIDDRVFPGGVEFPEEGGILVHKVGGDLISDNGKLTLINAIPLLYPEKGFPTPERVDANNKVKRYLMGWVLFFDSPAAFITCAGFLFLPWRYKRTVINNWMFEFVRFARYVNGPHMFVNPKHYALPCQELRTFIGEFLLQLGLAQKSLGVANHIAHIIEYDHAYRWWIEDIASVVTKEQLMKHPRRSVATMFAAFADRHPKPHIVRKFKAFATILSLLLLLPRVRRAFRGALAVTDWKKIQLDAADTYHVLRFPNYKFMGIPAEARKMTFVAIHNGNPPRAVKISGESSETTVTQ